MDANGKYFNHLGFLTAGILNLTPKSAMQMCDQNAFLIDVREPYLTAYKQFHVKNIMYLPWTKIKDQYENIPRETPVIIADSAGIYSKEAYLFLKNKQYKNMANLAGGFIEWERGNFPVKINIKQQLVGSCMCQLKPRM